MASRLSGAKPLPEPMLAYCQLDSWEYISVVTFELELFHFHSRKCIGNCRRPFCPERDEVNEDGPENIFILDFHVADPLKRVKNNGQ